MAGSSATVGTSERYLAKPCPRGRSRLDVCDTNVIMVDDVRWVPPGLDECGVEQWVSRREELAPGARESVRSWAVRTDSSQLGDRQVLLDFQVATGKDFGLYAGKYAHLDDLLSFLRDKFDDQMLIWLIDFIVSKSAFSRFMPQKVRAIDDILRSSGSIWRVGDRGGRFGLIQNVPTSVAEVVQNIVGKEDRANKLLRTAWAAAFGTDVNASAAYSSSVKAVEVYSTAIFIPNDSVGTLGKCIAALRNKPSAWEFDLQGSKGEAGIQFVLNAMELLWQSQRDRHGAPDYSSVSQNEARAAVFLATMLVAWMAGEHVRRSAE